MLCQAIRLQCQRLFLTSPSHVQVKLCILRVGSLRLWRQRSHHWTRRPKLTLTQLSMAVTTVRLRIASSFVMLPTPFLRFLMLDASLYMVLNFSWSCFDALDIPTMRITLGLAARSFTLPLNRLVLNAYKFRAQQHIHTNQQTDNPNICRHVHFTMPL